MNKLPLLVLLSLAIAAAAFLVWTGGDTHSVPPSAPEARLVDDPEAGEAIAAELAVFDDAPESPDEQLPAGLLRIAAPAAENNVRHLVMQVWEGEEGVPAVAAAVFVLDGFEGDELEDPYAQHWSTLAESHGLRFLTDRHGLVELPQVREWAIVTAQRPGSYGFAKVGREHREVETITLRPDETVTVRVTDGEERPVAGVPVGLVQSVPERVSSAMYYEQLQELEMRIAEVRRYIQDNPDQREAARERIQGWRQRQALVKGVLAKGDGAGKNNKKQRAARKQNRQPVTTHVELRARRLTDEDGIAVFRHFQVYRHQQRKWWLPQHIDQFEAVLMMPLRQPESRAFKGRPVPTETLELRLPPTGSIALRTVDRDGRPFSHPVHAELRMYDAKTAPWERVQIRKEQGEVAIVFPFVGLGLEFKALCRLDDDDFRWNAPPFAGPSDEGQQVTVDLVVAPNAGMLFGRLFDGADKPLAGARPTFLINSAAGRLEGEEVTLDAAGRFHLPYKVLQQHRPPFRLEIRRNDVRPTAGLAMMLPALPPRQVTDLGDLRIDGFGRLAHGTVVDDRGLRIAGATVQLQRERNVGDQRPRLEFVDEAFTVERTDAEGRYELFGALEIGRYRLRTQAKDHFPFESPNLRRGEQVDLVLQRKSRILGTVLTPDWMKSNKVRVRVVSAIGPQQVREGQVHDAKGKKYIFFDWVKAGTYNLSLRVRDYPDPFLRVDGLVILPGQQGLHPRLQDLDLGAFLFRFEVSAVDEHGQKIQPDRPLLARIVRPDGRTGFVGFPWKNGRVEVVSASTQVDVLPLAAGYRAQPTVLAQGRNQLRFLSVPPVDLQAPGLRQLVGTTPVQMVMELISGTGLPDQLETWDRYSGRISGWYAKTRNARARLQADDSARLALMCDGRYRVIARLGMSKRVRPVPVELGAVEVRLVAGAGPQQVVVNVDPEQVQQALAELAQRQAASGR